MENRKPAEVFSPGEQIRDELAARDWTQTDLAEILGVALNTVSDILNDKRGISAETAKGLAEAFGTTAQVWLNLDARYRLASANSKPGTRLRSQIYSKAPVREMIKRQWIEGSTNPEVLAATVCKFLHVASLDEEPKPLRHAARKSTHYNTSTPAQIAWLCRVEELAPAVFVQRPFTPTNLTELTKNLRALAVNPADIRRVAKLLSDYGIRFLVVEPLPGSKIDGVCFWLGRNQPVIALSLRLGKLHNFWHNLLHELAHVANGDGTGPVVDTNLDADDDDLPLEERAANKFAVETLIPPDVLEDFVNRVGPTYSLVRIHGFATRIGVHPSIVIGQLAHHREITWARFGAHLPTVREHVTATALTDGWGHSLPTFSKG